MKEDSVEEEDGYNTDPNLQMHIDDEEWERENGRGPKEDIVKEAGKTALIQTMNNESQLSKINTETSLVLPVLLESS